MATQVGSQEGLKETTLEKQTVQATASPTTETEVQPNSELAGSQHLTFEQVKSAKPVIEKAVPNSTKESKAPAKPSEQSEEDAIKGKFLKTQPLAKRPATTHDNVMKVRKRDGTLEPVDVNKIVQAVLRCSDGLCHIDPMRVATRAISGLYDGATTKELDSLCIRTAALLVSDEPEYSRLASRLLNAYIDEEVSLQGIKTFSDSVAASQKHGILSDKILDFVTTHKTTLNHAIERERTDRFEYFGLRTLYDRYLLKNPDTREVLETPQYFFMRVACGLANSVDEAIELYRLISSLDYMPSTPTLFNSGTHHSQLSSCYLLDSPQDSLESIYEKYADVAMLSKWAGGIGLSYSRVRSRGSLIQGTNGHSNGVVPWLKTLDSSVAAVNQGGKRKGAACVYLETWHGDIEDFLQLRDNTGDEAQRTHNLNLANWVPDLFMRRVESGEKWSLFDSKECPEFVDLYGEEFEKAYVKAEEEKRYIRQVDARELYSRMMKTLAQTGNGWMTFKDRANLTSNQTGKKGNVIHLSNLCTEILEVTSDRETAVCNLGSINLSQHVINGRFDFQKLAKTVRTAIKYLDRVVDINFYPIEKASSSNLKWRPVGLGVMGIQDVFFKMGWAFDSEDAQKLSKRIHEEIYYHSLSTSADLAEELGPHANFKDTRAAKGELQFDYWDIEVENSAKWEELRTRVQKVGLRNSLMIALAPTATIASIVGCTESIEPQVSNLFKRETLSGEFLQINRYLVAELKRRNLWTPNIQQQLKECEGSIQLIPEIPDDVKRVYRTAWEIPMRSLIDMSAQRGAFIDQSHSLNLFMESPTIGKLSSMYMYAWKKGIKTTYYLRSRPATRIKKSTIANDSKPKVTDSEAIACSLENPEACESCQ